MYPKSSKKLEFEDYTKPKYDQLVSYTDGNIVFLLYESTSYSFQGEIYDNDDGIIIIRYLLDICGLLVICLDKEIVS